MATANITRGSAALGQGFAYTRDLTTNGHIGKDNSLAAAKTGTLTTRTSNTAGTLTMAAGHGFTDGQVIDIYWSTGQCTSATIGTVATNSVPFTSATGDVLPAATTAITAMVQTVEPFSFADADLKALFVKADLVACSVTFRDGSAAVVGVVRVKAGGKHFVWDDEMGATIPVSDDVASIAFTHGDSAAAHRVYTLAMVN